MYMYVIASRAKQRWLESELQFQSVACWADLLSEFPLFFFIFFPSWQWKLLVMLAGAFHLSEERYFLPERCLTSADVSLCTSSLLQQQLIVSGLRSVMSLQTYTSLLNRPIRLPAWIATGNPGTPSQNLPPVCTLLGLLPHFGGRLAVRAVSPDGHFFCKKPSWIPGKVFNVKGKFCPVFSFL